MSKLGMLCLCRRFEIKLVLLSLTIFGLFEPNENQPLMMNNQESSHLVDECVISPLQSSLEVNFEDSVTRVGLRRFWSFESALWLCYFVLFVKDKKKR